MGKYSLFISFETMDNREENKNEEGKHTVSIILARFATLSLFSPVVNFVLFQYV